MLLFCAGAQGLNRELEACCGLYSLKQMADASFETNIDFQIKYF